MEEIEEIDKERVEMGEKKSTFLCKVYATLSIQFVICWIASLLSHVILEGLKSYQQYMWIPLGVGVFAQGGITKIFGSPNHVYKFYTILLALSLFTLIMACEFCLLSYMLRGRTSLNLPGQIAFFQATIFIVATCAQFCCGLNQFAPAGPAPTSNMKIALGAIIYSVYYLGVQALMSLLLNLPLFSTYNMVNLGIFPFTYTYCAVLTTKMTIVEEINGDRSCWSIRLQRKAHEWPVVAMCMYAVAGGRIIKLISISCGFRTSPEESNATRNNTEMVGLNVSASSTNKQ